MTELIQIVKSEDQLIEVEEAAWKPFNNAPTNFFCGNHKAESYCDMVADLV
jgi:hypothetical protein